MFLFWPVLSGMKVRSGAGRLYSLRFGILHEYDTSEYGIAVPVILRLCDRHVSLSAHVDTGSSLCIFNRGYAEMLGLEVENGHEQMIGTAGGSFRAFGHDVTLVTFGLEFDSTVYFAEHENFSRNVLGRLGWIQKVHLALDDYACRLYIRGHDED